MYQTFKMIKMKNYFLIALLFSATSVIAQKTIASLSDTDELTINVKKLNQTYAENDFSLWNELLADDAIVRVNNSIIDKQTILSGFKGHHSIYNDIKIPEMIVETKYFKDGSIWTSEWFTWLGTGNKTGVRYSNIGNFNYQWKDGKIVNLVCIYDTAGMSMELGAN